MIVYIILNYFPICPYRWYEYFNAGLILADTLGQLAANKFLDYASDNFAVLTKIRADHSSRGISIGSDQSLWNLYLQNFKIPTSTLDERFNLGHLQRKDVIRSAKFVDMGLIYHFNGLNASLRADLMAYVVKLYNWI